MKFNLPTILRIAFGMAFFYVFYLLSTGGITGEYNIKKTTSAKGLAANNEWHEIMRSIAHDLDVVDFGYGWGRYSNQDEWLLVGAKLNIKDDVCMDSEVFEAAMNKNGFSRADLGGGPRYCRGSLSIDGVRFKESYRTGDVAGPNIKITECGGATFSIRWRENGNKQYPECWSKVK